MTNLTESEIWENGVYQIELTDPVVGGPDGISNRQAKQLANRTAWLKALLLQHSSSLDGKQPLDATLTALAAQIVAADKLIYATGADTFSTTTLTAFARTLLDDASAATALATLGAAPLASPGLTGIPTAPTAADGTLSQQIATTAFVRNAMAAFGLGITSGAQGQPNWPNASLNDCTGVSSGRYRTISTTTDMPAGFGTANVVDFSLRNGVDGQYQAVQTLISALNNRSVQRISTTGTSSNPTWSAWREVAFTDSPAFTGTPTAPTAAPGTNTQQVANTAFVQAAVAALVDSSPAALDTLNELAAALGNDPNFATTMTNALATKAPLASPALTGAPTAPTQSVDDSTTKLATTAFVYRLLKEYGIGTDDMFDMLSVDLNTVYKGGFYYAGTGCTNSPIATGYLLVMSNAANYTMQVFHSGTRQWMRSSVAGAWGSWVEQAPLLSPAFTGIPTAPTAAQDTSTSQVATTSFVMNQAATQLEAEAGTVTARWMSPLRVFQAIAKKVVQATEAIVGIAAIATQAQTNAGTDDATIVTPKKLRAGFAISINTNGYIAFPSWMGGLIFQWGRVPIPTGSAEGSASVSLPIAFPTGPILPIAAMGHGGTPATWYGFNAWCSSLGASTITCVLHTGSTTRTETGYVNYLAIGR